MSAKPRRRSMLASRPMVVRHLETTEPSLACEAWWYTSSKKRDVIVRISAHGRYLGTVMVRTPRP